MIDKMLVSVVTGMMLIALAVEMLLLSLPFFKRIEFDAICHKYVLLMDHAGGIDDEMAGSLRRDLAERGFDVTTVSGTEAAGYGDSLDLYVSAGCPVSLLQPDLHQGEVVLSMSYQSSTVCRVLKDFGADP